MSIAKDLNLLRYVGAKIFKYQKALTRKMEVCGSTFHEVM